MEGGASTCIYGGSDVPNFPTLFDVSRNGCRKKAKSGEISRILTFNFSNASKKLVEKKTRNPMRAEYMTYPH